MYQVCSTLSVVHHTGSTLLHVSIKIIHTAELAKKSKYCEHKAVPPCYGSGLVCRHTYVTDEVLLTADHAPAI